MEGISDIRIVGIDDKRPPLILREPYIDLYFKLSHKTPTDWCRDFNELMSGHPSKPKVDEKEGLFINTWVRKPDEIVELVDLLKEKILECNQMYIERVEQMTRNASDANAVKSGEATGEQGRLNKIIADLDFGENPSAGE